MIDWLTHFFPYRNINLWPHGYFDFGPIRYLNFFPHSDIVRHPNLINLKGFFWLIWFFFCFYWRLTGFETFFHSATFSSFHAGISFSICEIIRSYYFWWWLVTIDNLPREASWWLSILGFLHHAKLALRWSSTQALESFYVLSSTLPVKFIKIKFFCVTLSTLWDLKI